MSGRLREFKNKGEVWLGNQAQKWSRSLTRALLKSLSDISNGVSQKWSQLELVAYESGRKESVDCIQVKATDQCFPVVLFIMLYKVVLTFESVDEILKCDHLN